MYKATQQQTKLHNKQLVLKTIYSEEAISRAMLARATHLTRTTVSNIVTELLEDGLIAEIGPGPSLGGKRPILLSLVDNARTLISIDLGNSEFRGGTFDLRGRMLHNVSLPVDDCQGEGAVQLVYDLIDQLIAHSRSTIGGIGIGTPGVTDAQHGVVYEAVNLGWHNLPLKNLLETRYGFPIHIANDSQVAVLGEYIFGQNQEMPNLVVVKAGRGISAGVVIDGRLYIGERSGQGEIGHVMVVENGKECRCGHRGCLETVAGTRAIIEQAQAIAEANPDSILHQLADTLEAINTDVIYQAFAAGDETIKQIVTQAGRYLGMAVAHLVALLNIQHVVIGGRLARFGDWLVTAVRQEMARRVLPKIAEETEITLSELGDDIVIQGGAALLLSWELELV
ncbi:MAG: ROK family transcriptional regulator [Ardenticatenaceae bacterium]|nr:ROK family transcriptional regulator [Ardenticatenaceae bacterium]